MGDCTTQLYRCYIGITISHSKDPYVNLPIEWKVAMFFFLRCYYLEGQTGEQGVKVHPGFAGSVLARSDEAVGVPTKEKSSIFLVKL